MKNTIKIAALIFLPSITFATQIVPVPKSGVQIVALDQMDIPQEYKDELKKRVAEEKAKGFYETANTNGMMLLQTTKQAEFEKKSLKLTNDPLDTQLKTDYSQIKLVFPFKGLPIDQANVVGYAPIGAWNNGWTGIKVFFKDEKSTCSYSYFDLGASHGAAQLNKEGLTYVVNKKPTSLDVEGNYNEGFLYTINWFGKASMSSLECANMEYKPEITKHVLELANKIDKAS
ncbi:MAG TPA: hypothetical protein VJ279_08620 [Hanamia sp.]|jgi:hypothetical protein|nr:hypothetical protein [Hanamia sp.]